MKIIIQKFGGTSVRDQEGRMLAIGHIKRAINSGYKVVVVVSAMGRKGEPYATDTLLSLVGSGYTKVSSREQDMLMACGETISAIVFTNALMENGISACALNGGQAGFRTTSDFKNAKIIDMKMERLLEELGDLDAVVVTGFQGINAVGDVTTIGRGGSDTSAAALGVALQADYIDIFTDVDGIMTADPRISPSARALSKISYTEVCNLAYQGAKVLHPRAVEIAMQANVPIRIRSTYSENEGTLVTTKEKSRGLELKDRLVTSIAHLANISQIKIHGVDGQFNLQSEVFNTMARAQINVDFISILPSGIHYTVSNDDVERAEKILRDLGYDPHIERNCAKVSVVGAGISGVPGVTARIVTPLSERNIQILQSADSHTTIWILVKEKDMVDAVNILHEEFHLHLEEELTE